MYLRRLGRKNMLKSLLKMHVESLKAKIINETFGQCDFFSLYCQLVK